MVTRLWFISLGRILGENVDKEDFYISLVDNTNAGQYVFPFESGLKI